MKKKAFIALLAISIVAAIAVGIVVSRDDAKKPAATPEVVTRSSDNPGEEPITEENYDWKGKATDPKMISIPSIKKDGFIQKVGIDQRNEVGVPSNINLGGWFTQGAIPGEKGLSIIDGHVDGISKPGIFKDLAKLKAGQKFTIEFGNGSKKTFIVREVTKVSKVDAPSVLFSANLNVPSQLNLITCGGTYDRKARHYLDRIIVTSELV